MKSSRLVAAVGLAGAFALTGITAAQASPTPGADRLAVTAAASQAEAQLVAQASRIDESFLRKVHQDSLFAIVNGGLAVHKGRCSTVRRLGGVEVRGHRQLDRSLRLVAARERVAIPSTLTRAQQKSLRELARKSGTSFDRAWLRVQVVAHQQTLKLIQRQLRSGQMVEVKQLAREAAPIIRRHLDLARQAMRVC
ncbi:DUF4142 domain-containing protein [Allokutzneria oryzae]|uniref:DUF4142 domain-containing protein n=1 Tax=Allokutzneria oryzae TaxID=1378989 RepID=A0ABV5ZTS6_9PSEU